MDTMKKKLREVAETRYGVYVWEMPDGRWVGDDEGHYMLIPSEYGDTNKIKALTDAAKSYGVYEGKPKFLSGRRKVSDAEYDEQQARLRAGLTPDPWDVGEGLDMYRKLTNGN